MRRGKRQKSFGRGESGDPNILIAKARCHAMGLNEVPFMKSVFKIADLLSRGSLFAAVNIDGKIGTFAKVNYGSLPLFCMEFYSVPAQVISFIFRRFEEGPVEPISKLPYKTLGGAFYIPQDDYWHFLTEDKMKECHTIDPETGVKTPVEAGILFSTIPEMFPGLFEPRYLHHEDQDS